MEHAEQALARQVRIVVDIQAYDATLDSEQIRRALDNLVLNAIEAAPAHSDILVRARIEGELLSLSVRDAGVGPPASIREHLFEPFVTGRPDGTGLGLSLVREIAHAHGGTAGFASDANGTVFEIRIPCL